MPRPNQLTPVGAVENVLEKDERGAKLNFNIFTTPARQAGAAGGRLARVVQSARPTHWTKNLLVFAPLLFGGLGGSPSAWRDAALGFVALSLTASGCYLLNDVADWQFDRNHPDKHWRPIASAELSRTAATKSAALLVGCGFALSAALSLSVLLVIVIYTVLSCGYTAYLKRIAFIDCIALATLMSTRLSLGSVGVHIPLSTWLLSVAFLSFFSLGLSKRWAEFIRSGNRCVAGRGYQNTDLPLVRVLGFAAGAVAALVLCAYVASGAYDARIYARPYWLWLAPPILVAGLYRLWNAALIGDMHSDPLVYALKDPLSLALAAAMVSIFVLATT